MLVDVEIDEVLPGRSNVLLFSEFKWELRLVVSKGNKVERNEESKSLEFIISLLVILICEKSPILSLGCKSSGKLKTFLFSALSIPAPGELNVVLSFKESSEFARKRKSLSKDILLQDQRDTMRAMQ